MKHSAWCLLLAAKNVDPTHAKKIGVVFFGGLLGRVVVSRPSANGTASGPIVITKRQATFHTGAKWVQFCFSLHLVHSRTPVSRQRGIIGNCQPAAFVSTLEASIRGTPLPIFSEFNEICTNWVSLHDMFGIDASTLRAFEATVIRLRGLTTPAEDI